MEDEVSVGQVLDGKYRVERVLGRGGMGVVVAARHLALEETVAIKFLTAQALANPDVVTRFEREARAAVKIKNEHVVRIFDVGRLPSGSPYMVMEFLQGEDLAKWLASRGPLPVEQAVDFVLQACVALAAAHVAGIVHRDVKPGNLFCVQGGDGQLLVKVLDFGISKLMESATHEGNMSVTKTAAVMGSPLYMSPEQVQSSKDVDLRTDVWALGVVLFELVAGRVPFHGEAFGEVAIKIATQRVPPLSSFRRDVPTGFDAIVGRCLEKDRFKRFENLAELAQALAPFASRRGHAAIERIMGIGLVSSGSIRTLAAPAPVQLAQSTMLASDLPETVSPWSGTGARHPRRRALLGTLALVTLLGIAGFVVSRRGATSTPGASSSPVTATPPSPPPTQAPPVVPAPVEAPPPATEPIPAEPRAGPAEPEAPGPPRRPVPARRSPRPARESASASHSSPVSPEPTPVPQAHPAPAKADCDPPYTLDDQGRKKFKPECFLK